MAKRLWLMQLVLSAAVCASCGCNGTSARRSGEAKASGDVFRVLPDGEQRFSNGKAVELVFTLVNHSRRTMLISEDSTKNIRYELHRRVGETGWTKVGGGGGHQVRLAAGKARWLFLEPSDSKSAPRTAAIHSLPAVTLGVLDAGVYKVTYDLEINYYPWGGTTMKRVKVSKRTMVRVEAKT